MKSVAIDLDNKSIYKILLMGNHYHWLRFDTESDTIKLSMLMRGCVVDVLELGLKRICILKSRVRVSGWFWIYYSLNKEGIREIDFWPELLFFQSQWCGWKNEVFSQGWLRRIGYTYQHKLCHSFKIFGSTRVLKINFIVKATQQIFLKILILRKKEKAGAYPANQKQFLKKIN